MPSLSCRLADELKTPQWMAGWKAGVVGCLGFWTLQISNRRVTEACHQLSMSKKFLTFYDTQGYGGVWCQQFALGSGSRAAAGGLP